MKVGSLFSGAGGLDLAVEMAFPDAETVWFSEYEKHAAEVHEHWWPHAPNLGDVTQVDWTSVEPVQMIHGGFPCQDISHAGKQAGIKEGTRSGLWHRMEDAIGVLRPEFVLLENVGPITSNGGSAVLGGLASMGYDARWGVVRASAAGAPHHRARWFCVAYPHSAGWGEQWRPQPVRTELPSAQCLGQDRRDEWGEHAPWIERWERAFRPAPPHLNDDGNLSARFGEWVMGWPDNHTAPCSSRSHRLKMVGNGVVPHQAVLAMNLLWSSA